MNRSSGRCSCQRNWGGRRAVPGAPSRFLLPVPCSLLHLMSTPEPLLSTEGPAVLGWGIFQWIPGVFPRQECSQSLPLPARGPSTASAARAGRGGCPGVKLCPGQQCCSCRGLWELETFPPSTPACAGGGISLFSASAQQRTPSWGTGMWGPEIPQFLSHKCQHLPLHHSQSKLSPLPTEQGLQKSHPSCYSLNTSTGDSAFCQHYCDVRVKQPSHGKLSLTAVKIHIWLLPQKFRKHIHCLSRLETIT